MGSPGMKKLVPAMQKVNTTIDVPIADLGF